MTCRCEIDIAWLKYTSLLIKVAQVIIIITFVRVRVEVTIGTGSG